MESVERSDDEGVAPRAGDVEGLDALDLVVRERAEIERMAAAGEDQRVGAAAAIDGAEGEVGDGDRVVAGARPDDVETAAARQRIGPAPADDLLGRAVADGRLTGVLPPPKAPP